MQSTWGRTKPADTEWDPNGSHIRISARGSNGPLPPTIACAVLAVFFLVEAFEPFSVLRLVLGLAVGALAIRMAGHLTLMLSPEGVTWHTVLRTRRWSYLEIDHFEIALRRSSSSELPSRVLRVHLADGTALWLRGLEQSDIDEIAERLNRVLRGSSRRDVLAREAG